MKTTYPTGRRFQSHETWLRYIEEERQRTTAKLAQWQLDQVFNDKITE